jgi:hypothetical protein
MNLYQLKITSFDTNIYKDVAQMVEQFEALDDNQAREITEQMKQELEGKDVHNTCRLYCIGHSIDL